MPKPPNTLPKPRLPPLPPVSSYTSYFSRPKLRLPPDRHQRVFSGRYTVTNRKLCDEFVKALKIRPGEIILEIFPGVGCLTRSLLNGGNPEDEAKTAAGWLDENEAKPGEIEEDFPGWRDELVKMAAGPSGTESTTPLPALPETTETTHPLPRMVVVCEPSPDYLVRALGMLRSDVPYTAHDYDPLNPSRVTKASGIAPPLYVRDVRALREFTGVSVVQSGVEPRLLLSPATPYLWQVPSGILDHEIVQPHLEKYEGKTTRKWSDPEPPITLVAQMPDSMIGEQMIVQWISSVIGAAGGQSWIWRYGRIRMAFIMAKGTYDVSVQGGETG